MRSSFMMFRHRRNARMQRAQNSSKRLIVAAIDFGTTYSGYGFLLNDEYESDPTKAFVKSWNSGSMITEKTPTCVLISPEKRFLAFGYEAENKYIDLVQDGDKESHYYFKTFKMSLHKKLGEKIESNYTLEDEMGKSLPAILVFSMAIKYLIDDMMKVGHDRQTVTLEPKDIYWVLTVPAIWTDAAKQFMRLAANKAGIDDKQLSIALEPEAASLYCRHLSIDTTVDRTDVSIAKFKTGTRYMILDAGGGTIDITVHEVTSTSQVKEVASASGGGWGGILVDKAFEDLVIDIFTKDIYKEFKKNETEDWLDMWREFELKKRTVSPTSDSLITIKFPATLVRMFTEPKKIGITEAIARSPYASKIKVQGDKLRFKPELMRSLFKESIGKTIDHVTGVLRNVNVKAILMVGGFSESPMLQDAVKKAFARKVDNIIIPVGASSTILRGALVFGHSPKSITERVLQYTYGVDSTMPFIAGVHPVRHRIVTDCGIRCDNIFSKHVERNQTVTVGEPQVKQIYTPTNKFQRVISFNIYASTLENPMYVDEDCTQIGQCEVIIADPDDDLDRKIEVGFTFSGTEIQIDARDVKTGNMFSTTINFLC